MRVDLTLVADAIRAVAAEEILPRFGNLAEADQHEKQPGQLVTVADIAAERRLSAIFRDLLPGSVVVGEEGVAEEPGRLDALKGDGPVWLVDPVDGTQNFAEGSEVFACMAALMMKGRAVAAWIYDPVAGRMAMAEEGSGAWREGVRLRASAAMHPSDMSGRLTGRTAEKLRGFIGRSFYLRCAGQEYLRVASGEAQFALFRRLFPWDHAPGEFLCREAGATSLRLDGTPYAPQEIDASLLVAPDRTGWEALRTIILAHAP